MDGGCHVRDINNKAKMVIGNMLQVIELCEMKDPDKVCNYVTSKQMKGELTASSTGAYLRYYSSFYALF